MNRKGKTLWLPYSSLYILLENVREAFDYVKTLYEALFQLVSLYEKETDALSKRERKYVSEFEKFVKKAELDRAMYKREARDD